jgi:hypothetical protein
MYSKPKTKWPSEARVALSRSHGYGFLSSYPLGGSIARTLIMSLLIGLPAHADEFDVLVVYSEAEPFNDGWQTCAASYAKREFLSHVPLDIVAADALRSCRGLEIRLYRFFVERIGRKSAQNLVALLRERYRQDLAAAINKLRTSDQSCGLKHFRGCRGYISGHWNKFESLQLFYHRQTGLAALPSVSFT